MHQHRKNKWRAWCQEAGLLFNLWPFAVRPHADLQPDGAGELDHSHPLGVCHRRGPPAPQRGHGAPASCRNQEAGAEDRHGWEDEENGRHAAVCCNWHQEEEDDSGSSRFHSPFPLQLVSPSSHMSHSVCGISWLNESGNLTGPLKKSRNIKQIYKYHIFLFLFLFLPFVKKTNYPERIMSKH